MIVCLAGEAPESIRAGGIEVVVRFQERREVCRERGDRSISYGLRGIASHQYGTPWIPRRRRRQRRGRASARAYSSLFIK